MIKKSESDFLTPPPQAPNFAREGKAMAADKVVQPTAAKVAAPVVATAAPSKAAEPVAEVSKKLRNIQGVVAECVQETSDTWTLHVFVGDNNRNYKAGQFVSIDPHQFPELSELVAFMEHKKGRKEVVRAYSMASAPHEPYVSVTVKPERFEPEESDYPPLLSPFLASSILRGRPIRLLGYSGAYTLADNHGESTDEVLHMVAGSGAVPNFALIKDELINDKNANVVHTFIDVNKTYEDIIYREELRKLQAQYPTRLKLIHMLTREPNPQKYGDNFFAGRPDVEFVRKLVKDPSRVLVFACGAAITKWQRAKAKEHGKEPAPRFMESVGHIVEALGIDKKRYKREVYG